MREYGLQSQTALGLELGAALHCCVTPGNLLGPREAPFPLLETEKKAHTVGLMRRFDVGPWEGSWFLSAGNGGSFPPLPCNSGGGPVLNSPGSNPTSPLPLCHCRQVPNLFEPVSTYAMRRAGCGED